MRKKQSLFHISKRDTLPLPKALLIRGGILLLALVFCGLITTILTGKNPIDVYATILSGAFGTSRRIGVTFRNVAVLLGLSLAVTPAFKMRFWNIGAEGQTMIGCLATTTGWFGEMFLSYGFLAYMAVIIALCASYFLNHTRSGLHLRAVGESASTADAAGINVTKYKYMATCIGSMIAGLGGLYYVMDYANGVWSNNAFGDRGWLAIALVIFTIWRPNVSILASILFGGLYILNIYLPTPGGQMAIKELYKMLPYAITLVVLIVVSLRKKREDQPPASLGLSYFREER